MLSTHPWKLVSMEDALNYVHTWVTDIWEFDTETGGVTDSCDVTLSGTLGTNGSSVNDEVGICF